MLYTSTYTQIVGMLHVAAHLLCGVFQQRHTQLLCAVATQHRRWRALVPGVGEIHVCCRPMLYAGLRHAYPGVQGIGRPVSGSHATPVCLHVVVTLANTAPLIKYSPWFTPFLLIVLVYHSTTICCASRSRSTKKYPQGSSPSGRRDSSSSNTPCSCGSGGYACCCCCGVAWHLRMMWWCDLWWCDWWLPWWCCSSECVHQCLGLL